MRKLQYFTHRFTVRASLSRVAEFHRHASSMAAITPPPIIVRIHHAPDVLTEGSHMDFTMWLGPLPLYWQASIEDVSENGFVDRQLKGPFAAWQHRHTFVALGDQSTEVIDEVQVQLRSHPFWWLVGLGMRLGLPFLFAFRAWKTRRLLQ
jgi:ligand-binding SRPBCC domain-containing protein